MAALKTKFDGRILIVGFGSIGQGVLPLILKHIDVSKNNISIITADEAGKKIAQDNGIDFTLKPITKENYREVLEKRISKGDFVVNLSVSISSVALIELCQEKDALYIDTCIEPWEGVYTDSSLTPSERSNYAMRESALKLKTKYKNGRTAIVTHGANPGLVSHFVKQAMLNIAKDTGTDFSEPKSKEDWANLGNKLGVKVIHIAERDTQVSNNPKKPGEFVNTWSIDGFVSEGCQPSELGWGAHEKELPKDGKTHDFGSGAAIYLLRPGASTKVRTWTPIEGPFHGFLITHGEAISIADYFTVKDGKTVTYRPTVHYAYHPSDDAVLSVHEIAGKNWQLQDKKRLMMNEITEGTDELGVLLMGHKKGAYWFGSVLSIHEARKLVPYNNATSLQVTSPVLAGMIWAIENPNLGVVEPDEMDFRRIMEICAPYLGKVSGTYSDWTPLKDRGLLFEEDIDKNDPWQFKNFRVV